MNIKIESDILRPEMVVELEEFVGMMVLKLEKNVHKDAVGESHIPTLIKHHMTELGEFVEDWMQSGRSETSDIELADAANFLFLIKMANR